MPTPSSQGSTVVWNGAALGSITGWSFTPSAAVYVESTNINSTVVGTGANARVRKTFDCIAIDPGTLDVTLYGCPPYGYGDSGLLATLAVTFSGGSFTLPAYLESLVVTGQVGQFLVGRATFKLSGAAS
jgi:hypothetical protein